MLLIILTIASYFVGSIPTGFVLAKLKGVDIRNVGSGNIGATNISRVLGIKYAMLVGFLDFLKGALPTLVALQLLTGNKFLLVALAALFGHVFPITLRFRGGKGVATFAGSFLIVAGIENFLLFSILWIVTLFLTRVMSLTNLIVSIIIICFYVLVFGSLPRFYYVFLAALLIWFSHRENIRRLISGKEAKLNIPDLHKLLAKVG
ncbi:MAG: acyl-phosphate glycerol 3-phosphate acyltransferase [Candidatus Levybacteria bacterium RIFCSPHIGHO2_01_FULL_40_10]|nr:MAG: acyl-phosphate glycerol 3-phosphate acyltransferase [Candidatus Levybacteria bacterium RIFCSPHIGHO2_01_FULL_40_10]